MAQNNMDKDFSNKLNEREIQPSPMAWDRLDAMLTVAEQKKTGRKYNWLYVAAGFLGFLFIGMMLFNQTEQMTDSGKNEVVIEDNSIKDSVKPTQNLEVIKPVYEKKAENSVIASEEKVQRKSSKENTIPTIQSNDDKRKIIPDERLKNVVANNQTDQNQSNSITTRAEANGRSNQKTEQVKKFTYVNVDELLASVDKAPTHKKEVNVKVDSNTLLSQVDGELELSFREKVIKTVNKNFRTVRVALTNRNVQQ